MVLEKTAMSMQNSMILLACVVASYLAGRIVYRRYWHPLAGIPGPFLPAVTTLYQSYYNSRYYLKIEELHKEYGPVVRIRPDEVHLSDPTNYDKIYYMGSKFYKSPPFYGAFGLANGSFGTVSNEKHRQRRSMLNPMFSRKMVLELEALIHDIVSKLFHKMRQSFSEKKPFDLHNALRCVSVDIISTYAFDKSFDLMDTDNLGSDFNEAVLAIGPIWWTLQQLTFLQPVVYKMPLWIGSMLSDFLRKQLKLHQDINSQIRDVKDRMDAGKLTSSRKTIFSEMLNPGKGRDGLALPIVEVEDEAFTVMGAAAETVGSALTCASYHIASKKEIYAKLRSELMERFLTAIIKESLRLSFGVPGRLPRVVPESGATFNGHYMPPGTIVGMSSWVMHRNDEAFPDPMKFDPDRWLDPVVAAKLEKHMVPFGRGQRMCIGMPLAYCELYVTIGRMFHHFEDLEVFDTTDDDFAIDDFFAGCHRKGANLLKVIASA